MFNSSEAAKDRAVEGFFAKVNSYHLLTAEATLAWMKLLRLRRYARGEFFVRCGEGAPDVAFVFKGLFSQYAQAEDGTRSIKRFFAEGFFVAAAPAMLTRRASTTTIEALERSTVLEYDFQAFRNLTAMFRDVAEFYIRYMERHWIIEKEPEEIALRRYTAREALEHFRREHGNLLSRLKKQDVAAYLGITPTQMSRILAELATPKPGCRP